MTRLISRRAVMLGSVGLLVGAAAVVSTAPAIAQSAVGHGMMRGDVDQHFIRMMIPHHEDAITMARLAATQAEHPEIVALAAAIESTQAAEIAQMRDWYRAWYGTDVPTMPAAMRHDDPMALDGQRPFDKAFIERMVPHHEDAVRMAVMARRGAVRPELQRLLDQIITTQQAEIDQMRAWYAAWYGVPLAESGSMCGDGWEGMRPMTRTMPSGMAHGWGAHTGMPGMFRFGR